MAFSVLYLTSLSLSGFLPEMSDTTPPTQKMALLLLADQGQKKRRRQRQHHIQRESKISWRDICDLVTSPQWERSLTLQRCVRIQGLGRRLTLSEEKERDCVRERPGDKDSDVK